jgi:hypothetical protein
MKKYLNFSVGVDMGQMWTLPVERKAFFLKFVVDFAAQTGRMAFLS